MKPCRSWFINLKVIIEKSKIGKARVRWTTSYNELLCWWRLVLKWRKGSESKKNLSRWWWPLSLFKCLLAKGITSIVGCDNFVLLINYWNGYNFKPNRSKMTKAITFHSWIWLFWAFFFQGNYTTKLLASLTCQEVVINCQKNKSLIWMSMFFTTWCCGWMIKTLSYAKKVEGFDPILCRMLKN